METTVTTVRRTVFSCAVHAIARRKAALRIGKEEEGVAGEKEKGLVVKRTPHPRRFGLKHKLGQRA
jgi:hypothetical protein